MTDGVPLPTDAIHGGSCSLGTISVTTVITTSWEIQGLQEWEGHSPLQENGFCLKTNCYLQGHQLPAHHIPMVCLQV